MERDDREAESEFKPGAVLLARMTNAPIIPIAYAAKNGRHWKSWDQFVVPRPFTRIVIAVGEPMIVPKTLALDNLEPFQKTMESTMARLIDTARASFDA